jgi:hypothetical protein
MNVISYNRAYSLYPRTTFNERETLLTPRNPEHRDIRFHAIQKYKDRGWRVMQQPSLRNEPLYAPRARRLLLRSPVRSPKIQLQSPTGPS